MSLSNEPSQVAKKSHCHGNGYKQYNVARNYPQELWQLKVWPHSQALVIEHLGTRSDKLNSLFLISHFNLGAGGLTFS